MFNMKKKKLDQVAAYQAFFASEDGKKVLFDLMRTHYIQGTVFSKDPLEMALKEGERNVVLRILSILRIDSQKLLENIDKSIEQEAKYQD